MASVTNSILKTSNLRLTDSRKEVLLVLQHARVALSHTEIRRKLPIAIDRITSYRTLVSFRKKGLVHCVVDPHSGVSKYLINTPALPLHHFHFKCITCSALFCLPIDAENRTVALPPGYHVARYCYTIEGTCDNCPSATCHTTSRQRKPGR